jgi:hypothetical protein
MALFSHIKHPQKRAFLAAYTICASVKRAAKISGVHRDTHYDWMEADPEYAATFKGRATELGGDAAEDEATRRAEVGVLDYVLYKGEVVMLDYEHVDPETGEVTMRKRPLMKRRFSDRLLLARLKALKPEKYGDKQEITGAAGAPVSITVKFV